jgi:molybdopterin-synthase adenylyltransferase
MAGSDQANTLERDPQYDRYSRQILFPRIGREGQERLLASRVTLIGCGALGTVLADILARAGVGFIRIVDRDYVERNNLQRQILFTEHDATDGAPKAVAAARSLAAINSDITIEPIIADVDGTNIESLITDAGLILDGTDNFETRFLINDAAVKHRLPWVYGACVGAEGMVLPILPGRTPCLRCVWDQPPPPGQNPTCDTAGVIAPIVHIVAALQATEAIKILTGQLDAVSRKLMQIHVWETRFDAFDLAGARESADCPCCVQGRYEYLTAVRAGRSVGLCGRDAVQIAGRTDTELDFEQLAARIGPAAKSGVQFNRYLMRFEADGCLVTVFRDGRAIIKGTSQPDAARSLYAKYVGS